jgi:hypothetical protein
MATRHCLRPGIAISVTCLLVVWIGWQVIGARSSLATSASILISEIQVRGSSSPYDEFVELYNASDSTVDISGYYLEYRYPGAISGEPYYTWAPDTIMPPHRHLLLARPDPDGYDGSVRPNGYFLSL